MSLEIAFLKSAKRQPPKHASEEPEHGHFCEHCGGEMAPDYEAEAEEPKEEAPKLDEDSKRQLFAKALSKEQHDG